jgi:hypothetical protein
VGRLGARLRQRQEIDQGHNIAGALSFWLKLRGASSEALSELWIGSRTCPGQGHPNDGGPPNRVRVPTVTGGEAGSALV